MSRDISGSEDNLASHSEGHITDFLTDGPFSIGPQSLSERSEQWARL